jgi:CheY-like chemotaxis protein
METGFVATALIADPSAPVRRAAPFLLESLGFETVAARSGEEALMLVRSLSPALILADGELPGLEGGAAIEAIRGLPEGRDACLFHLTADGGPAGICAALDAGADDYLARPFDRQVLALKLAQARARGKLAAGGASAARAASRHVPKLVQDNSSSWRFRRFGRAV